MKIKEKILKMAANAAHKSAVKSVNAVSERSMFQPKMPKALEQYKKY